MHLIRNYSLVGVKSLESKALMRLSSDSRGQAKELPSKSRKYISLYKWKVYV